jgi:hypothetical protein
MIRVRTPAGTVLVGPTAVALRQPVARALLLDEFVMALQCQ